MHCFQTENLVELSHTIAFEIFKNAQFPWQVLPKIKDFVVSLGKQLAVDFVEVSPEVWVHKSANVAKSACLMPPCIVDANSEIRHCAFVRGGVVVGKNCVVGNSVEIKNSILFDGVQVPHFNYVGDSILGYKCHFGAGAVTSNVKCNKTLVCVKHNGTETQTSLKKFGAIVGDFVEVGCNAVLNPGTIVGKNSIVYPTLSIRGVVAPNTIVKSNKEYAKRI